MQQKIRVSLMLEAPDAPAELVKLREPKSVCAFDDDRVAVRNIESALDDCRANEHVMPPGDKLRHHFLELMRLHLAMADADVQLGQKLAELRGDEIDRLHAIVQ